MSEQPSPTASPEEDRFERQAREDVERLERQAREIEDETAATAASLHETAKWIASGIAVSAGGIVAGASISSLGALPLGARLAFACASAFAGLCALGLLLWSAIDVMASARPTLRGAVEKRALAEREYREIEGRLAQHLDLATAKIVAAMPDAQRAPGRPCAPEAGDAEGRQGPLGEFLGLYDRAIGSADSEADRRALRAFLRVMQARVLLEHRHIQFHGLRRKAFVVTPVIALLLGGFAWAANPEKTDVARLRPIQASLAVRPEDLPALRKLLDAPECARATLDVIVVGEWKSGAQDVVTAPKPGCAPVRLRLAHGRLSAAD